MALVDLQPDDVDVIMQALYMLYGYYIIDVDAPVETVPPPPGDALAALEAVQAGQITQDQNQLCADIKRIAQMLGRDLAEY